MADEEKKDKDSRPNSAASSKSSKSDKSHKSHKSDKSDKSHKSHKSDKSDKPKSAKKDEDKGEAESAAPEAVAEQQTTDAEAPEDPAVASSSEAEVPPPPPPPAQYTEGEADGAETTAETETKTEEVVNAEEVAAVRVECQAPEAVQREESRVEERPKSVAATLTEEELERFEAMFEMYATEDESSGVKKVKTTGIKMLFRFMGEIVNEAMLSQWLREEDRDVDGMFDFEEFCSLYKKRRQPADKRREDLLMCVNKLFPLHNGADEDYISLDKVSNVLKHMNTVPGLTSENTTLLTNADVDDIIEKVDKDKNKKITRQEFVDFLCSLE